MEQVDVVIVGAGHGGAQAAAALRQRGFEGSILMIGREPELPYERPPLSKDYLAGRKDFERLLIRPTSFWAEQRIELRLGCEVVALDPNSRTLALSDGGQARYASLIWAAGGDPRRLTCEGAELAGVHTVRTRADADRLRGELDDGVRQVVVIGGGYIGLEAAAALSKLGCDVVVIEALPRVLARVCGQDLSDFYQATHRAHGVEVRINARMDCLVGAQGRVAGVLMVDGSLVPAEAVIVGIGIVPCVEPLLRAGAACGDGVRVDDYCRTSLPNVYAIGDCAAHANIFAEGRVVRLESVQNANDMAATVAEAICGTPAPYRATPWFWSDQYGLKLQTVGLSSGHDEVVVRGEPASEAFSIVYLKNGRVIALDCVNRTKDYVRGRRLVEARAEVSPQQLADSNSPL